MSDTQALTTPPPAPPARSIMRTMAERFGMESAAFERTLMETVMPRSVTKEAVAAFLVVAHEHKLNPFTREIFAFEGQGGGVRPIVSIDGWIRLVNDHPMMDGSTCTDILDGNGNLVAVEAIFYRKDRAHPTVVREYLAECQGTTMPWKKWPRRMLRHKAFIQGARIAFGFSGIEDEDEYERYVEATVKGSTPSNGANLPPAGARTLRDLVPPAPARVVEVAKAEPTPPPDDAIPAPRWFRVSKLSFAEASASADPAVKAAVDAMLAEGAAIQADKGEAPLEHQQLAEAARLTKALAPEGSAS